jgi:hypothetical protein
MQVFDQSMHEPIYQRKNTIAHVELRESHPLLVGNQGVLVRAITAIGTIFLDWDAEKTQGVTGLAIVFSWAERRCSGGRHGIGPRLGTIGE